MIEYEITIFQYEGRLCGITTLGAPTRSGLVAALEHFSFVRGNVRLHVVSHSQNVGIDTARQFAQQFYEGHYVTVKFDDIRNSIRHAFVSSARGAS